MAVSRMSASSASRYRASRNRGSPEWHYLPGLPTADIRATEPALPARQRIGAATRPQLNAGQRDGPRSAPRAPETELQSRWHRQHRQHHSPSPPDRPEPHEPRGSPRSNEVEAQVHIVHRRADRETGTHSRTPSAPQPKNPQPKAG